MLKEHIVELIESSQVPQWLQNSGDGLAVWISEHEISPADLNPELTAGKNVDGEYPILFRLAKPPAIKSQIYSDGFYFPFYAFFQNVTIEEVPQIQKFFDAIKTEFQEKKVHKSMYGESQAGYIVAYLKIPENSENLLRIRVRDASVDVVTEPPCIPLLKKTIECSLPHSTKN